MSVGPTLEEVLSYMDLDESGTYEVNPEFPDEIGGVYLGYAPRGSKWVYCGRCAFERYEDGELITPEIVFHEFKCPACGADAGDPGEELEDDYDEYIEDEEWWRV
jgi:hypothetical protein